MGGGLSQQILSDRVCWDYWAVSWEWVDHWASVKEVGLEIEIKLVDVIGSRHLLEKGFDCSSISY